MGKCGRWAFGDLAERRSDGKLFRVVGFIRRPAVLFREVSGEERHEAMVVVADSLEDLLDLIRYAPQAEDEG